MEREIDELLTRGVGAFIDPGGIFKEKLLKKIRGEYPKDIVIKFGVDPTRPDIHIGHAVVFRKLRQFQELGCKVIFLVGDYTAQIGDPTGKSKVRPEIDQKEVEKNMETFLAQIDKILITKDQKIFDWIKNSEWFTSLTDFQFPADEKISIPGTIGRVSKNSFTGKAAYFQTQSMQAKKFGGVHTVTLRTFLWTLKHITHSQLIERDLFQERIKNGEELYLHEMMYPVLQGIDSSVISKIYKSCDLEIGGTDQTFNMLMGRQVMKSENLEQQAVLSMEILPGTDGVEKMSKSLDNYIAITDTPSDMFGKTMSIPDSIIATYFSLAAYTPLDEIKDIESKLLNGKLHPKDAKMRLAREIVAMYHGKEAAEKAEKDFTGTFSKGGLPEDLLIVKAASETRVVEVLLSQGIVESKSEWRRLIDEGAVSNALTGEKIENVDEALKDGVTLKVGKRRFIKIEVL